MRAAIKDLLVKQHGAKDIVRGGGGVRSQRSAPDLPSAQLEAVVAVAGVALRSVVKDALSSDGRTHLTLVHLWVRTNTQTQHTHTHNTTLALDSDCCTVQ